MDAVVDIGENAEMRYSETHYHGLYGGIEVVPKLSVKVGRNARYETDFTLTTGRVGKLAMDYTVEAGEDSGSRLVTARLTRPGAARSVSSR